MNLNWRTILKFGFLGGIISFYLSAIGMTETFSQRYLIGAFVSMGLLFVASGGIAAGALAAHALKNDEIHTYKNSEMWLSGIISGLVASIPSIILIFLIEILVAPQIGQEVTFRWRDMFVNFSPELVNILTFGQGLAIGGIIVEREDLVAKIKGNDRYAHFNEPDESYHGLVYSDLPLPLFTLRVRLALLRDLGAAPSPFNSWLYIQGLETLPLRMKQHSASALAIAEFLESHPKVKRVNYPGLPSDPNYHLAQRYLRDGYSGLLSFEVEDLETAKRIANATEIFKLVVNIGDSKSIITHPASTTHQQLSSQELIDAGVPAGLIRLSVGLEDAGDLIADLKQALEA